jgi:hypothetical protein
MLLTLDNLVKSIVGRRAKAQHPITVVNPDEFFTISDVKIENYKIYVRGENTIWFGEGMVELCDNDDNEESKLNPVCNLDGNLMPFITKVDGKPFRCDCGCNVFHKPDKS